MKKLFLPLALATLIATLTGCASTPFAEEGIKDCAIVSIMYNKRIYSVDTKIQKDNDGYYSVTTEKNGNSPFDIFGRNIDPNDLAKLIEKEYTSPIIPESNEIIRKWFANRDDVNLISAETIAEIPEYRELNNSTAAKLYSLANVITSNEYVLADYKSKIEPVLSEKTGANLFAYIKVDIIKEIKGPFKNIKTGTVYPKIEISCIFTDSNGKQKGNVFASSVYYKGVNISLGNYDKDTFYDYCLPAIDETMDLLMSKL